MKTALAIMASLSFMVVLGCESPRGGGISSDEGFKIDKPILHQTLKQGETQSVTISLNRGEQFKRDVTLDMKATPGIVVEPTQALVKASERTSVHLRITAARDAALGEYKVYVTGTPTTGEPAKTEFTVKVVSP